MESALTLSLIHWTQKITGTSFPQHLSASDYITAFRDLLLEIDSQSFFCLQDQSTKLNDIITLIRQYYIDNLNSHIPSNAIPAKLQPLTAAKISQIFQLIFGIAFKVDHSKYVVQILNLKQGDQQILMSFVDTLMKGESQQLEKQNQPNEYENKNQIKRLLQQLQRKQFQTKLIKQRNDELQQSSYQLKQRIIVLKDQNQKISQQLHQLQSQKTQLLIQLGLNHYDTSYQQIVKRYKQQIKNYQVKQEQLQGFLDSQNSQIEERSSQIELLKQSMGSNKELEEEKHYKNQEYTKMIDQNNQQLGQLRRQIEVLNQQIVAKNQRVMELNKDRNKYLEEIKELKINILKSQKPLAKYQQLRKLYRGFISSIKPHIA